MGFLLFSLAWSLAFSLRISIIVPFMLALGLVAGLIPTATFAAAPETIGRQGRVALANGAIMWGQNLGVLLGPVTLGQVLATERGWAGCSLVLVLVALCGLLAGGLIRVK